jgi:hypothetical protein
MEELVVTRKQANGACFYRLAEGEAVEVALNEAWAKAEAEQGRSEKAESGERRSSGRNRSWPVRFCVCKTVTQD